MRITFALVVAALFTPLFFFCGVFAMDMLLAAVGIGQAEALAFTPQNYLYALWLGLQIGVLPCLGIGVLCLPLHRYLQKLGLIKWRHYLLAALLPGMVLGNLFFAFVSVRRAHYDDPLAFTAYALMLTVVFVSVFWYIAVYKTGAGR